MGATQKAERGSPGGVGVQSSQEQARAGKSRQEQARAGKSRQEQARRSRLERSSTIFTR